MRGMLQFKLAKNQDYTHLDPALPGVQTRGPKLGCRAILNECTGLLSITDSRLSKCSGKPLWLCGQRLPELNLIPVQVIDPGKATVGFIHSFGVNLYALLF